MQPRAGGLDPERVEYLKQVILNGGEFKDPIVVFRVAGVGEVVSAGFHRHGGYVAARAAAGASDEPIELKPLRADYRDGTLEEAIEFAEEDNLRHGQPLSDLDKRGIFERRVKRGHAWARMSNRAVAAALGVGHQTIGRWRKELEEQSTGPHGPVEGPRIGKDGREYDVSKIQAANTLRWARGLVEDVDLGALGVGDVARMRIERRLNDGDWRANWGQPDAAPDLAYGLKLELSRVDPNPPRPEVIQYLADKLIAYRQAAEQAKAPAAAPDDDPAAAGEPEPADAIGATRAAILEALAGGPLSPAEIRSRLSGATAMAYEVARDTLRDEGRITYDRDPMSGRVTYRLATGTTPAGLPPVQVRHLDAPAHSDTYDVAREQAYLLRTNLERAILDASDAIEALLQIKGVRALHALEPEQLQQLHGRLDNLKRLVLRTPYHLDELIDKLMRMAETGRPYDEEEG